MKPGPYPFADRGSILSGEEHMGIVGMITWSIAMRWHRCFFDGRRDPGWCIMGSVIRKP